MKRKDPAGPNVSGAISQILGGRKFNLPGGALGVEVGRMLAEIAVELQDRIDEAKAWKIRFEAIRGELKALAAIVMQQKGERRIVLTRAELNAVPEDLEILVETPEPGVRIYRLVDRSIEPADPSKVVLQ